MSLNTVKQLNIGGYDNNFSYFIIGRGGKKIAIVDPGNFEFLENEIKENGFLPEMILLTHSHHDHVEAFSEVVEKYKVPVYSHENARAKIKVPVELVRTVDDGDVIEIDGVKITVMHTPGHIDDAVCYYMDGSVITGDTLFVEGCGRADLDGSNVMDLHQSLERIKKLPDETKVFPGHDYGSIPISTIAHEKGHNRFLKCKNLEDFILIRNGL